MKLEEVGNIFLSINSCDIYTNWPDTSFFSRKQADNNVFLAWFLFSTDEL